MEGLLPVLTVIVLQVTLLLCAALFILRGLVLIISSSAGAPFVKTPQQIYAPIAAALAIRAGETCYELGSGDGGFTLWCAAAHPDARFVGIERNPLLVRFARFRAARRTLHNVTFIEGDVRDTHFADAQKIYLYMLPAILKQLLPRLQQGFHGRIASRAFEFNDRRPDSVVTLSEKPGWHGQHRLYVYDF